MRETFHAELDQLGQQLGDMCHAVGEAMGRATTALLDVDLTVAEEVISGDLAIDEARARAEEHAYSLLALQAPVATDLRIVLAAIRVAESLERMGDLARHVAQVARRRHPQPAVPEPVRPTFADMGRIAVQLAHGAEQSILNRDLTLFTSLDESDDQIDTLHRSLFAATMDKNWAYGVTPAVDVTLLGRFYERYSDHAVAVAKRMAFVPTGTLWGATVEPDGHP